MRATVHIGLGLDTMADYFAIAVCALRRQEVDCAFEAVERVLFITAVDHEGFIVVVTAYVTLWHLEPPYLATPSRHSAPHHLGGTSARVACGTRRGG